MSNRIESIHDNVELARRFEEMAKKFLHIYETEKTTVDFSAMEVTRHPCGTVACHGGFAALALGVKPSWEEYRFQLGGDALADFLGFDNLWGLRDWASQNAHFWGSPYGHEMFSGCGHLAFTADRREDMARKVTLLVISQWYSNVAARLIGVEPKEIIYHG